MRASTRRRRVVGDTVLAILFVLTAARADEPLPRPAGIAPADLISVQQSRPPEGMASAGAGFAFQFLRQPVTANTPIDDRIGVDLLLSGSLLGYFQLNLDLPIGFFPQGRARQGGGWDAHARAALGGLRLDAKLAIPGLRRRFDGAGFGVALTFGVDLPTAAPGPRQTLLRPGVVLDRRFVLGHGFRLLLAVDLGAVVRPKLANTPLDVAITYSGAFRVTLIPAWNLSVQVGAAGALPIMPTLSHGPVDVFGGFQWFGKSCYNVALTGGLRADEPAGLGWFGGILFGRLWGGECSAERARDPYVSTDSEASVPAPRPRRPSAAHRGLDPSGGVPGGMLGRGSRAGVHNVTLVAFGPDPNPPVRANPSPCPRPEEPYKRSAISEDDAEFQRNYVDNNIDHVLYWDTPYADQDAKLRQFTVVYMDGRTAQFSLDEIPVRYPLNRAPGRREARIAFKPLSYTCKKNGLIYPDVIGFGSTPRLIDIATTVQENHRRRKQFLEIAKLTFKFTIVLSAYAAPPEAAGTNLRRPTIRTRVPEVEAPTLQEGLKIVEVEQTIRLPRSVGAAAARIPVRGAGALVEGSEITRVELIARGRGIREVGRLVRNYGGRAQSWRKLKGIGQVETHGGRIRRAELHWYEGHGVGRVEFKVKTWLD